MQHRQESPCLWANTSTRLGKGVKHQQGWKTGNRGTIFTGPGNKERIESVASPALSSSSLTHRRCAEQPRRVCGWGSQLGQLQQSLWLIRTRFGCWQTWLSPYSTAQQSPAEISVSRSSVQSGHSSLALPEQGWGHTDLSCTGWTYSLRKRFRSALMGCSPFSMASLSASVGSGSGISNLGGKHHRADGNEDKTPTLCAARGEKLQFIPIYLYKFSVGRSRRSSAIQFAWNSLLPSSTPC